jgi:DNA-binding transcriptional ArsR family regulator
MRKLAYTVKEKIAGGEEMEHPAPMPSSDCTSILKALADRTRLRLLKVLLADENESVNDLSERLDLSQYNVSKHLRILKNAGIVDVRANAQRREYFVAKAFRKRLQKEGMTLDFGCCSFDFSKLPD